MSYADQPAMSPRKMVSIALVVLLHAIVGYAFITGLAYNVIKKAASELKTVDVTEQPPPPPQKPPPPPPEQKFEPPPVVAPPPIVRTPTVVTPPIVSVPTPPPAPPIHVEAPPAPPPPPKPVISQAAAAKGNPNGWIQTDDYPSSAERDGHEGKVRISFQINEQGRIENCAVTSSSGFPELDAATCNLVTRRGRYTPAKDSGGQPIRQTGSLNYSWVIPKE